MKNFSDFTPAQQRTIIKESGYSREDWLDNDELLIPRDEWKSYCQDLAVEVGAISSEVSWPTTCIDWEWAARELEMDYSSVEVDGEEYLFRAWWDFNYKLANLN